MTSTQLFVDLVPLETYEIDLFQPIREEIDLFLEEQGLTYGDIDLIREKDRIIIKPKQEF